MSGMSGKKTLGVGVIGAGAISGIYLQNMTRRFDNLHVIAVAANHLESAQKRAAEYGVEACTVDRLLADERVDMVVVLTPVGTHYDLVKRALTAGKHVYTEKTLADSLPKAAELAALAEERGLYLGAAPDTFLGAAWQTARAAIDAGAIGEVRSFAISANRDNRLLLSLFPFLPARRGGTLRLRRVLSHRPGEPAGAGEKGGGHGGAALPGAYERGPIEPRIRRAHRKPQREPGQRHIADGKRRQRHRAHRRG